jgi:hypothetical protein
MYLNLHLDLLIFLGIGYLVGITHALIRSRRRNR